MSCPHCGKPITLPIYEVVKRYSEGKLSLGHAALLANLRYFEMMDELEKRGIQLCFGPVSIREAIEESKKLRKIIGESRFKPSGANP